MEGETEKIMKNPNDASKSMELDIKTPYIVERNAKGQEFKEGKITSREWEAFQKEWKNRVKLALYDIVKKRVYVNSIEVL